MKFSLLTKMQALEQYEITVLSLGMNECNYLLYEYVHGTEFGYFMFWYSYIILAPLQFLYM